MQLSLGDAPLFGGNRTRSLFMMAIGAFLAIAFVAPDLFDTVRDDLRDAAEVGYSKVQENLETATSK